MKKQLLCFLAFMMVTLASFAYSFVCPTPNTLTSLPSTNNTLVAWVGTGATYDLQWKSNVLNSTWTTVSGLTTSTYNIEGLSACSYYIFRVKSNCTGTNGSSNYSDAKLFKTMGCPTPCAAPTTLTAVPSINGVVLTWLSTATNFDLQYRKSGTSTWITLPNATNPTTLTGLVACTNYVFRVKANCGTNSISAYSASKEFKTTGCPIPCATPITLTALPNATGATLAWVSSAANFEIQYRATTSSTWATITNATNPYTLTGLSTCTNYVFRVKAICGNNSISTYSGGKEFKTTGCPVPCAVPTALTATPNETGATITWVSTAPSFELQYKSASAAVWTTVSNVTNPHTLTGLLPCTYYLYRIKANCDPISVSEYTITKEFKTTGCPIPCAVPTTLTVVPAETTATLAWVSTATSFDVQFKSATSATWTTLNNVTNPYTLTGLTACTNYAYRVKANCAPNSVSAYSSAKEFKTTGCILPCTTPLALTALPTETGATLAWTSTATNFELQYKVYNATTWTTVNPASNPYTLTGLIPCTYYLFRVKALCSNTNGSDYSVTKEFKTTGCPIPCSVPQGLSAVPNETGATISWIGGIAGTTTTYELQYALSGTSTWVTVSPASNPYTLTGLTPCTNYRIRVRAICDSNSLSEYTPIKEFKTLGCIQPCTAVPTALTVIPAETSAMISWVSTASFFEVQYRVGTSAVWTTISSASNPYTITGLTACTNYLYRVRANCSTPNTPNWSDYSALKEFKTTGCIVPCATPTGLVVTPTENGATMTWVGTSATASYELQYGALTASGAPITWITVSPATNPYTLTSLTACTFYAYRVRANCGTPNTPANWSDYSGIKEFKTLGCIQPCTAVPTALTVVPAETSAMISWVSTASFFEVQYRPASATTWTTISSATNPYTVIGLTACTNYVYRVRANCSTPNTPNWSDYSGLKEFKTTGCIVPCAIPTALTAIPSETGAVLAWTPTSATTTYELQYGVINPAGTPITWISVNPVTNPYTISGLTACTYYAYRVRVNCATPGTVPNWSDYSPIKEFKTTGCTISCPKPTALSAVPTETGATLSWIGSANAYEVQYLVPGTISWITVPNVTNPLTLTNLSPCTIYTFRVRALCGTDVASEYSVKEFQTMGCVTPCSPPQLLPAYPQTTGAAIGWNASTTATGFEVDYRVDGTTTWTTITNAANPTLLSGLTPCTIYLYRVRATCGDVQSNYTNIKEFKTTGCASNCLTPTGIVATTNGNAAVINATSNGNMFDIEYTSVTTGAQLLSVSGVSFPYTLQNLLPCTLYTMRVRAWCTPTLGSEWSAPVQFTTGGCSQNVDDRNEKETTNIKGITIAPNPSENDLIVSLNITKSTECTIELMNLQGQSVIQENLGNLLEGEYKLSINGVSDLSAGVYFVKIRQDKKVISTQKWVKL
jgi:trimeric autotransporter adhesin